jgi:chloramphenicol-sensitive protein RarD
MLYAALASAMWGVFPMYFKALRAMPADEILAHRILWSLAFLAAVLAWRRQWTWLRAVMRQPRVLAAFAASALLLSTNWLIYIWAVNHDRVLDASLGYFINPLFSIVLGLVFLRERLRVGQGMAIGLAVCGVAWLTWQSGHPPWIALMLAVTFGAYGLLRKTAVLGPLEGLALETLLLSAPAAASLIFLMLNDQGGFLASGTAAKWLLAGSGPLTAIPLLLFAAGARRIPLSLLGLLQYLGPTLQLTLGVWLYDEPFGGARLAGFAMIWTALLLYSLEGLWRAWAAKSASA